MLAILTTHPIQYQAPLWQALARDGRVPFEVWYLTRFGIQPTRDREFGQTFAWDVDTLAGYPHRFLETVPGATPAAFWKCRLQERLRDRLRTSGARAIWIQGWQVAAYWQAVQEAHAAGVEVWLRGESNDLLAQPFWKQAAKRMQLGWLFSRVDRFLCIGPGNRRLYQQYGVGEHQLYAAPYAVDNERFASQAAALGPRRIELRRQWGIADDAFCVLFCGKFVAKKRPMDLVAAARHLMSQESTPNVHLLFAGSGALGEAIRRECRVVHDAEGPLQTEGSAGTSSHGPRASFAGFLNQTEVSRAYVAADCLVLPSDHGETWGLVVNEALASGLPCLASDACGCAEELAGKSGSFQLGNVNELALKLAGVAREVPQTVRQPPYFCETAAAVAQAYQDSKGQMAAECGRVSRRADY